MPVFSIASGASTTFNDTTPGGGIVIDFDGLDNSLNIQINGVDLFVGGPAASPNELEFQTSGTAGQTVRFADGDLYGTNTPEIWQLGNTNGQPIVRLEINPDGTIVLLGVKANNGPLEPLELFNGLSVNTAAIAAVWDDSGPNTVVLDQDVTGPTNASGEIVDVPCFASGTLIETENGPVPVEALRVTDKVLTYAGVYKPIRWIGSCRVSGAQLRAQPRLKPIMIRAGSLGDRLPEKDLIVSPQHRILVSSKVAQRMFGCKEVLVSAKRLLALEGVETVEYTPDGVDYWHILFDEHDIVWSNGMPSESLLVGAEAMKALSAEARLEIQSLFPEMTTTGFKPTAARYIPKKGKWIKNMVQRHQKNGQPLYC